MKLLFILLFFFGFVSSTFANNQLDSYCSWRDRVYDSIDVAIIPPSAENQKDQYISNLIKQWNVVYFISNTSKELHVLSKAILWKYNCKNKTLSKESIYNQEQKYIDYYELDGYDWRYVFVRSRYKDGGSIGIVDNNNAIQGNFIYDTKIREIIWTYNVFGELFIKPFILPKKYWYLSWSPLVPQILEKSSVSFYDFKPISIWKGKVLAHILWEPESLMRWFYYDISTFKLTEFKK